MLICFLSPLPNCCRNIVKESVGLNSNSRFTHGISTPSLYKSTVKINLIFPDSRSFIAVFLKLLSELPVKHIDGILFSLNLSAIYLAWLIDEQNPNPCTLSKSSIYLNKLSIIVLTLTLALCSFSTNTLSKSLLLYPNDDHLTLLKSVGSVIP